MTTSLTRPLDQALPFVFTALSLLVGLGSAVALVVLAFDVPLTAESFQFERPLLGLLLLLMPVVFYVQTFVLPKHMPRLRTNRVAQLASVRRGPRTLLRHAPIGLRAGALTLGILALMGPQSIHARGTAQLEGIDIVLALDLSLSMQAADIQPTRFEATKSVVNEFIARRANDRIGAVVFGRDAFTLLPLTSDKRALSAMVSELQLGGIDGRGTAIGNAVGTALNRLRGSEAKSRVIILATDGESNSGNISPEQAAEFAATMGVKLYTILMGADSEAPVQTGTDIFGQPIFDKDRFPINPALLESMATRTGGSAFLVTDRAELENSFHQILNALEKSEIEDAGQVFGELYPAFLWPAALLLLGELLLSLLVLRRWP